MVFIPSYYFSLTLSEIFLSFPCLCCLLNPAVSPRSPHSKHMQHCPPVGSLKHSPRQDGTSDVSDAKAAAFFMGHDNFSQTRQCSLCWTNNPKTQQVFFRFQILIFNAKKYVFKAACSHHIVPTETLFITILHFLFLYQKYFMHLSFYVILEFFFQVVKHFLLYVSPFKIDELLKMEK